MAAVRCLGSLQQKHINSLMKVLLTAVLYKFQLTLYTLRHTIVLAIFEKFPRSRLFSDMRQISASDRTAHVVHCKKKQLWKFLKTFFLSVPKFS